MKKMLFVFIGLVCYYGTIKGQTIDIDNVRYSFSGANAVVSKYLGGSGLCTIPEKVSYNGLDYVVTIIGYEAFNQTSVTEVKLPETITTIRERAFNECKSLSKINLPSSLTRVEERAFCWCTALTQIIVPESTNFVNNSGAYPNHFFYACNTLRAIIYLGQKAPSNWTATSYTYVPDLSAYSEPSASINEAKVIEMITFDKNEFEYTGQAPSTTWTNNVEGYTATLSTSALSGDVGNHEEWVPVTFSKDNESFTANIVYRYTVKQVKLTAMVSNVNREYGEENPQFKITYSGFVNGEDESVLTTQPTISTTATKTSTVGDYPINVGGGSAANYEFFYEPGVLTINKAPLSAKVNKATKIYGSANPTFTIDYYGLKNDETAPAWTTAPYFETDANQTSVVGNYTVEALDGVPTNYELESITSGTLSITPAPLTIKAKTYIWKLDEDMPEFTLTYEGFQNDESNDVLTKQPTVTTNANKNSEPGDYEVIVSGAEAENYEITYVNGILKVIEGDPETTEDLITIKETGKTTYCSRYDLDFTNVEGIKAYTATGYDNDDKTIWLTRVLKVPARTGILLKGNPKTYKIPHSKINAYYTNMFKGNVGEAIKIGETDGDMTNYYLSGSDGTFKSVNGNANIGKNKAYLQLPTKVFAGTRSVCTRFDDEDSTTNINDTTQTNKNPDVFYNLQGQRVENLVKGIYIKNGKKVIIK